MLFGKDIPYPEHPVCKLCITRPCKRLFSGRIYPGKMIAIHHSEFLSWPCHTPNLQPQQEASGEAVALTDEIEVITGKLEITNPRWEPVEEAAGGGDPEVPLMGDTIRLLAEIKNYPEGAPVSFDIYDSTESTPLRIATVKGSNKAGKASAEWVVEDPQKRGEKLKLSFEAGARSKYTQRADIPWRLKGKDTCSILVQVICRDTGKPIRKCKVSIDGPSSMDGKSDDERGEVFFNSLLGGKYTLNFSLVESDAEGYCIAALEPFLVKAKEKKVIQVEAVPPERFLLWNIPELGGGFYRPECIPQYCINAYATVLAKLNITFCLLTGLRKNGPPGIEKQTMKDGSPCFVKAEPALDSGKKEVDRILEALSKIDPSRQWKAAYLMSDDGKSIAYQAGSSSCVIYRHRDDLKLLAVDLVKDSGMKQFGFSENLLCAAFEVPSLVDDSINNLTIVSPLSDADGGKQQVVASTADSDTKMEAKGARPSEGVLALSASRDLSKDLPSISGGLGADTCEISGSVTMPDRHFWETTVASSEGLVENPLSVAWADPKQLDTIMSWEALDSPDHPDEIADVKGDLADIVLSGRTSSKSVLVARKVRVINMVRASLNDGRLPETLEKPEEPGTPLPEDGILAVLCKEHVKSMPESSSTENQNDQATLIAQCTHFARTLSTHWPVVASLCTPK